MSTADNRVHWFTPLALTLAVTATSACGTDEPAGVATDDALARADKLDSDPRAALTQLPRLADPRVAKRRADLLDRTGAIADARDEMLRAIAMSADLALLPQLHLYEASLAARTADAGALRGVFARAAITEHPALAHRAVADASLEQLASLASTSGEVARAAGDRLEQARGPADALAAREQLIRFLPDDADAWDAAARSRIAAGKVDDALVAWDRAAELAPAQETFRIAPVRALVLAGQLDRAKQRAETLATAARAARDVELLVAASNAAALTDHALALALAKTAYELRTTDGRLAFLVGQRLAEAGKPADAARAYVKLLVCGAHGRAWHRHEVAAKLQELGAAIRPALDEKLACEPVETTDLDAYTNALRAIR